MGILKKEYNLPRQRSLSLGLKPVILVDDINRVKVCLYNSANCIRRTVYIIAAVANNAWIVSFLQTVMSWAKQNKIAGKDRGCTMTSEQLILLLLSCSQNVAGYQSISVEGRKRVSKLILQNHFVNCTALTCKHAKTQHEILQTYCQTTSDSQPNEDKYADVMLHFLNQCSRLQGEILKEVVDPSCEDGNTKLFSLKESQCHRLAERMLKAYHTLAQTGHFGDLVKVSKTGVKCLRMDLPQQVCKQILLREESYEEKLQRESKAEIVVIRKRMHGLVLEANGSLQSLQLICDLISDEANVKSSLYGAGANHPAVENAFMTVFKGCASKTSTIMFLNYSGPCQPNHDRSVRRLPRLIDPDPASSFSLDKFIERSVQQVHLINANYDESVHGTIFGIINFGTFYTTDNSTKETSENDFGGLFATVPNAETPNADAVHQGKRPRTSFIPTGNSDIDMSRFLDVLHRIGFVVEEETVEYRVSLKLKVAGNPLLIDAMVYLDEKFNPVYVSIHDIKWLCISVVSANKDASHKPYDCRLKIQSRRKQTVDKFSRKESTDFADVIADHQKMLLRTDNEVYGIHKDFLSRVRYMRKKHTKSYRLATHHAEGDTFLRGLAIEINYGTEYSRPSKAGVFQNIDCNRVEIIVVPELPYLHDEDRMKTFFTRCWQFAEEIVSLL